MPKMIFRGCFIRHYDGRFDDDAGPFVRIHFTAEMSDPVMQEMQWGPSAGVTAGKLKGSIAATTLVLVPNGSELKKHGIELECTEIDAFEFVTVKGDVEDTTNTELRFVARVPQKGAAARIEKYLENIGRGAAQLKVGYTKQEEMFEGEAEAETGSIASQRDMAGGTTSAARKARNLQLEGARKTNGAAADEAQA